MSPRHRFSSRLRFCVAAACAALLGLSLAGCAGTNVHNPDTAGATSGVTVYGTVDAGVGKVKR